MRGQTYPQAAVGYAQPTEAPSSSFLASIASTITMATNDMRDIESQVRGIADGVYGAVPEVASSPNGKPILGGSGMADDLRARLDYLGESINTLRGQVARLTSL